jgi:hypothetical protein
MREIGFGLACALATALGALLIAAWPVQGRPVAAFFPTGSSSHDISIAVAEAGGRLLQLNAESPVVITLGEADGYSTALYRAGAWLVIDAALAQLCSGNTAWSSR